MGKVLWITRSGLECLGFLDKERKRGKRGLETWEITSSMSHEARCSVGFFLFERLTSACTVQGGLKMKELRDLKHYRQRSNAQGNMGPQTQPQTLTQTPYCNEAAASISASSNASEEAKASACIPYRRTSFIRKRPPPADNQRA